MISPRKLGSGGMSLPAYLQPQYRNFWDYICVCIYANRDAHIYIFTLNFDFKVTWMVLKIFGRLNLITFFTSWTMRIGEWNLVWVTKHKFVLFLKKILIMLSRYQMLFKTLLIYASRGLKQVEKPFLFKSERKF